MSESADTKVVVLTGGTGYLGSTLVKALVGAGYTPVVLARNTPEAPEVGVRYITVDLSSLESLQQAADTVRAQYGSVEALVHAAAAPLIRKPLLALSATELLEQFVPQTLGAGNFFNTFVPLVKTGGHLIGITTTAIEPGAPYTPGGAYVPAKSALRGMLRTLAAECTALSVSAIAPAFMPGGLNGDMSEAVIEFIAKKSAPEDVTSPQEVAQAVLDLLLGTIAAAGKSVRIPGRVLCDL